LDRQNWTDRTGQDYQERTAMTRLPGEGFRDRTTWTVLPGKPEWDIHNLPGRIGTGQAELDRQKQNRQNKTVMTGLPRKDC
jgi:hypothetical protein